LDPLQQDAILTLGIDIQLVPVRSQRCAGDKESKRRDRDLQECHL
jgi:hypothetical protein